ncbi:MAG TPA: hypothetical protein PKI05_06210 [Thermogutta sp.]|nr:hypothetical protein [Thermogutta sp.]
MSLDQLDEVSKKIATLIYQSVPIDEWVEANLIWKMSPNKKNSASRTQYLLPDGTVDKSKGLDVTTNMKLYDLLVKHRDLSEEMGQPWWFQITVTVNRSGTFKMDFEYRENYRPEDLAL